MASFFRSTHNPGRSWQHLEGDVTKLPCSSLSCSVLTRSDLSCGSRWSCPGPERGVRGHTCCPAWETITCTCLRLNLTSESLDLGKHLMLIKLREDKFQPP